MSLGHLCIHERERQQHEKVLKTSQIIKKKAWMDKLEED